jgi:hypothetical protein
MLHKGNEKMDFKSIVRIICTGLVAISFSSNAILIGMSSDTDSIYQIDPLTGKASFLYRTSNNHAGVGLSSIGTRLFASDAFYRIGDPWDVRLVEINTKTGISTSINMQDGSLNWHGLASNEATNTLYAIDINDNGTLKAIDSNGDISRIGSGTGIDGRGMAYDDSRGILYATNITGGLYAVDVNNGESTFIGDLGVHETTFIGLAYDEFSDTLFANIVQPDLGNDGRIGSLHTIDTDTGKASMIGLNDAPFIDGLAWLPNDSTEIPITSTVWLFGFGLMGTLIMARPRGSKTP